MRLNDQIYGTNDDSRTTGDLDKGIKNDQDRDRQKQESTRLLVQLEENYRRMEAKGKEWESENARLSRRVLFIVLVLVAAAAVMILSGC